MCVAVETITPGRFPGNSLPRGSSTPSVDETPQLAQLNGKHGNDEDEETGFSAEVDDSRYQASFEDANASNAGVTAKELREDTGFDELADELIGQLASASGQNRHATVGTGRRSSIASEGERRRIAYPGAPQSIAASWSRSTDADDDNDDRQQLHSYVVALRRYPRLYRARDGRLVPTGWPRRTYVGVGVPARRQLHDRNKDVAERRVTSSSTLASSTPGHGNPIGNATASPLSSTAPTTTTSKIVTTTTSTTSTAKRTTSMTRTSTTTTTTTTPKASTTTNNEEKQEKLAAAVHDVHALTASPNDKKVYQLDVGPPEIGQFMISLIMPPPLG